MFLKESLVEEYGISLNPWHEAEYQGPFTLWPALGVMGHLPYTLLYQRKETLSAGIETSTLIWVLLFIKSERNLQLNVDFFLNPVISFFWFKIKLNKQIRARLEVLFKLDGVFICPSWRTGPILNALEPVDTWPLTRDILRTEHTLEVSHTSICNEGLGVNDGPVGKVYQVLFCFVYKHKDMSLISRTHIKKRWASWCGTYNLTTG